MTIENNNTQAGKDVMCTLISIESSQSTYPLRYVILKHQILMIKQTVLMS